MEQAGGGSGGGRSGHGVEAAGRAGAPACDLWTPSAGGRTESRREARPGPLNQGGLATAWSRSEGRSGRLNREGAPFLVLLVKKKEALRGERGGGEGGLREGQLVWYTSSCKNVSGLSREWFLDVEDYAFLEDAFRE